jgi:ABC-type antimicrobial peptide transport system permease subunit
MFYKLGAMQFLKNRGFSISSIMAVTMGVALLFGISVTIDTIHASLNARIDARFNGIDYTIYRDDGLYVDDDSFSLPLSMVDDLREIEGIDLVTSRVGSVVSMGSTSMDEPHDDLVFGMPVNETDESMIGSGTVIDCMVQAGSPENLTIESLLSTSAVDFPVVISAGMSGRHGYDVGDTIKIVPRNVTKLHATANELESVENGSVSPEELESRLRIDHGRLVNFTVVGIFIDGSEAPETPVVEDGNPLSAMSMNPNEYTAYISMTNALSRVFNGNDGASYFLVGTTGFVDETGIESLLRERHDIPVALGNVKRATGGYVNYMMMFGRLVLVAFTSLGMLSCSMLVKTLVQMHLERRAREIGIFKALGYKQGVLYKLITGQVAVMSSIGTAAGLLVGMVIPIFLDTSRAVNFFSSNAGYDATVTVPLQVMVSPASFIISVASGFLFPLFFALAPVKKARKWKIVDLLKPYYIKTTASDDNSVTEKKRKGRRKLHGARKYLSLPMSIFMFILLWISSVNMFSGWFYGTSMIESLFSTGMLAWVGIGIVSIMLLMVGLINTVKHGIGSFSVMFSKMSSKSLGGIRPYVPKLARVHSRKIRNVTGSLVMWTTLIMSMITVTHVAVTSERKETRTILGGDIVVAEPFIHEQDLIVISGIEGIDKVSLVTYVPMDVYRFYSRELSRHVINEIDDFGGKSSNVTENLNVIVIDPEAYLDVNDDDDVMYIIESPRDPVENIVQSSESFREFVRLLGETGSVIVQDSLSDGLEKGIGDAVDLSVTGISGTATVTGIVTRFPGASFMRIEDTIERNSRTLIVSRETMSSFAGDIAGNVDIMIKNKSVHEMNSTGIESIPDGYEGYSSSFIDRELIATILDNITAINGYSTRFSTFYPGVPRLRTWFNGSRVLHDQGTTNITDNFFEIPNRMHVFDPGNEMNISDDAMLETHYWIDSARYSLGGPSSNHNSTVNEAFYTVDNHLNWFGSDATRESMFGISSTCIVNKRMAIYDDFDDLSLVYEFDIGDVIEVTMGTGVDAGVFNFTVVGTIDTHVPHYWNDGTEREGPSISSKTMNHDFNENITTGDFRDIFDVDGNVFLTTYTQLAHASQELHGFPAVKIFGERKQVEDLVNHVYVDVDSTINVTSVIDEIRSLIGTSNNLSVIPFKETFQDKLTGFGSLIVKVKAGQDEDAISRRLREWYVTNGYDWKESAVGTPSKYAQELSFAEPVLVIMETVTVFAMIISVIGVSTTMLVVLRGRYRELAILKAMGFKNKVIQQLVFIETFVVSFMGIPVGMLSSIGITWVLFEGINQSLVMPTYFGIPWLSFLLVATLLLVVSITSSKVIAYRASRESIVDSLRRKE